MTPTPSVALLGTGTMGVGMARNIAEAGLPIRVWNRTRDKAEALAEVATVAGSVPEAVEGADVVITMLWDTEAVATTMEQARGHLAEDAVWLQQSTVGVAGCARLRDLAADLDITYVDAPCSEPGSRRRTGRSSWWRRDPSPHARCSRRSSTPSAGARCGSARPATVPGSSWWSMGGSPPSWKGLPSPWRSRVTSASTRKLFLEAVGGGPMDAPYIQMKGKNLLAGQLEPAFTLAGALKDVDLILEAAVGTGATRLMPGVRAHLARAVEAGHGGARHGRDIPRALNQACWGSGRVRGGSRGGGPAGGCSRDGGPARAPSVAHPQFRWVSHTGERFDRDSYVESGADASPAGPPELSDVDVITHDPWTAVLRCQVLDEVDRGDGIGAVADADDAGLGAVRRERGLPRGAHRRPSPFSAFLTSTGIQNRPNRSRPDGGARVT